MTTVGNAIGNARHFPYFHRLRKWLLLRDPTAHYFLGFPRNRVSTPTFPTIV
jgi:hypothetical protein